MNLIDELNQLISEAKEMRKAERDHSATPETRITAPSWEPVSSVLVTREYICKCGTKVTLPAMYGIRWKHPTYGFQLHTHDRPADWMNLPRERLHLEPIHLSACEACFDAGPSMPYIESLLPRAGRKTDENLHTQPRDVVDQLLGDFK